MTTRGATMGRLRKDGLEPVKANTELHHMRLHYAIPRKILCAAARLAPCTMSGLETGRIRFSREYLSIFKQAYLRLGFPQAQWCLRDIFARGNPVYTNDGTYNFDGFLNAIKEKYIDSKVYTREGYLRRE